MLIRTAMRVMYGNPPREYYLLDVNVAKTDALLYLTNWREDHSEKPPVPFWAPIDELYIKYEMPLPIREFLEE